MIFEIVIGKIIAKITDTIYNRGFSLYIVDKKTL